MHSAQIKRKTIFAYFLSVIFPIVVITTYLLVFAQKRYAVDSTLVVKQVGEVNRNVSTGIGALLGVSNSSAEDAYFLQSFVESRDLIEKLDTKLNLREEFYGSGLDPVFNLSVNATKEDFLEHFKKRVKITYDTQTGLMHLNTQGFSPEFSLKLNQEILSESDQYINDLSRGIASDQYKFAEAQFEEVSKKLAESREDLLAYQNKNEMYDPQAQAVAVAQIVNGLQVNLAQLQTEERNLLSYLNATAPQVVAIRSQISALHKQIDKEKSKLTSQHNPNKLNKNAADFEELKAKVEFSTDLYKIALTSLESARLESVRKLKKVVVITSPRLPEEALYPRVFYIVISSFLLFNIFFGIAMLISTIIREHKE